MATEIMVEGAEELAAGLKRMTDRMRRNVLKYAITVAAVPVLRAAQGFAPKGPTGDLADSLEIRPGEAKQDHADVSIGSFGAAGRAKGNEPRGEESYQHGFVELGTAHNPPRPYLRPALDATQREVVDIVTWWLKGVVSEVGPAT